LSASRVRSRVPRWLALAAVLWVAAETPAAVAQRGKAPAPRLQDLTGTSDLRAHFDQDADSIRIVLLLSPT